MPEKFHYECIDCRSQYPGNQVIYLCPACAGKNQPGQPPKGVLSTVYDYETIRKSGDPAGLFEKLNNENFLSLLPLLSLDSWPKLRIGGTPLYKYDGDADEQPIRVSDYKTGSLFRFHESACYLKDDSQNPTFSFKDRASALVSAWAKENGIGMLVAASTGNAGSSLAGICASQRQQAVIVVPASAPIGKLTQVLMYGATLIPVKGTYDDAFDLSIKLSEKFGWYNRNTGFNPLTIEGKKTVSFEIYRDLGQQVPDRIFVPVGDGVIFSGVCKGFEDLLKLGIIDRMPVLVAVQAAGSPNVVNNLKPAEFQVTPSKTVADSISVDVPRNFNMTKHYLEKYHGEWITVTDDEILRASVALAKSTGVFSEPAAVAAFAGMEKYRSLGKIPDGSVNVVMLTGSGLKDPGATRSLLAMPEPVEPEIDEAVRFLASIKK